jgi:two-component system chemotaxis response regulator CheB
MPHAPHPQTARLFVIDRSPMVVEQLRRDLASERSIELVGSSTGRGDLGSEIESARPHLILVDAGLESAADVVCTAVGLHIPVIAAVHDSCPGWETGVQLLEMGAIDLAGRPYGPDAVRSVVRQIRSLASSTPKRMPVGSTDAECPDAVVAVAAGPGGAMALADVLAAMPVTGLVVLAITPLPAGALVPWVDRLNGRSNRSVSIARNGDFAVAGKMLIAPADGHLLVRPWGANDLITCVQDGPTVYQSRPSAELLLNSLAKVAAGRRVVAGLVGGGGIDGVGGLAAVRSAGGRTLIESSQTSCVPDTSAFAESARVADRVVPRSQFVTAIVELALDHPSRRAA